MSNPLPEGAIPKLYRQRNKSGQEVGAWYCPKVKGKLAKAVNLRTQDYMKARERAREALNGRKDFPDDRYFDEGGTPAIPPEQKKASDDWTTDAHQAARQSVTPDAYFSPGQPKLGAVPPQETPDNPEDSPPPPTDAPKVSYEPPKSTGDSTQIPPEMMEGLVKQIANTIVELQLHGQEYLWIRWGKMQPGFVPIEHDARKIPVAIWESQLKKWMPTDVPIPEWAAAMILTAFMGGTVQFEGAKPIPRQDNPEPS